MASDKALTGVAVIEHDVNKDTSVVWSYPSITPVEAESAIVATATPMISETAKTKSSSFWTRFGTGMGASWYYTFAIASGPQDSTKVAGFAVVVQAKTFDPEKWGALASLFAKQYFLTAEPTSILETYLSAFTIGKASAADTTWKGSDFDTRGAVLKDTSLTTIMKLFGVESVLLWSAIMLKKRVLVYADKLKALLQVVRTLPQFAWHRQDWGVLRPWVSGSAAELEDLKAAGVYVAGVTDPAFQSRSELYDIYVDVPAQSIFIADHARRDFELGSAHRDVATAIGQLTSTAGVTDRVAVEQIAKRTDVVLKKIKSLPSPLTMEVLSNKALRLPANVIRFLYGVASVEPSIPTA